MDRILLAAFLCAAAGSAWGASPLYPDLVSWAQPGRYMYDATVSLAGGRRLLRFSAAAANAGAGPFELRGRVEPDGTTTAYQRVHYDDGSFQDFLVGTFVFSGHAGHGHFHFAGFAAYSLRSFTEGGGVGGVVAGSPKVGFAMWDVTAYDLRLPNAPPGPVYVRPEGRDLPPEGISVGWADVYERTLDDQWIDITGLPDGDYWLESVTDPAHALLELTHGNNSTLAHMRLSGNSVAFLGGPRGGPAPLPPAAAAGGLKVFPNPWRSDQHGGGPMRFTPAADGTTIRIFSLSGRLVAAVGASRGEAAWGLTDADGRPVASGSYLFATEQPGAGAWSGHVMVIR